MSLTRLGLNGLPTINQEAAQDVEVTGGVKAYTLTTHQASVDVSGTVQVGTKAYTITTNTASIAHDIGVEAGVKAYTVTPNAATVTLVVPDVDVPVSVKTYSITPYKASVSGSRARQEQPSGGWLFWLEYEQEQLRRENERKKRKKLKEKAKRVKDKLERELAQELQKEEEERERVSELKRLTALAEKHQERIRQELTEKVVISADRAISQGNYSAMAALDRELRRLKEEEEFLIHATNLLIG